MTFRHGTLRLSSYISENPLAQLIRGSEDDTVTTVDAVEVRSNCSGPPVTGCDINVFLTPARLAILTEDVELKRLTICYPGCGRITLIKSWR